MIAGTAEEAMKRSLDQLIAADYMAVMADLTPEAVNDAMLLAAGITTAPELPTSYEIEAEEVEGSDHRFSIRLIGASTQLRTWTTWREIDGEWKIVSLGVEPGQDTQPA